MASKIFAAKYPGTCGNCDEYFLEGTDVMYSDPGVLIHAKCPEEGEEESYDPTQKCPECFIIHSPGQKDCW